MSALDVLRQLKQLKRGESSKKVVEWGNADYINQVGIENLSRRELRNHLEARDLDTNGTRIVLIERLRNSLSDEQLHVFAYTETEDTEFLLKADLEERGSVYVCGSNSRGELGLGDTVPRTNFVVIPSLRGVGVNFLSSGIDMTYAITDEHDVYVWGGGGVGRTGINTEGTVTQNDKGVSVAAKSINNYIEPRMVKEFVGEDMTRMYIGLSHCIGKGKGGDCFVWGDGHSGQLGLREFDNKEQAVVNNSFPAVNNIDCGANHSVVQTKDGAIYTWGHAANGRLGIGDAERFGVPENEKYFFPLPRLVEPLEPISQIACGADHTLAVGAAGVYSWGSGSGGKLGIGDSMDRNTPCLIPKLRGKFVMQIAASNWHSMALICYPPLIGGGWLYTWGSGYHGQLAQDKKTLSLVPELVDFFMKYHLSLRFIATGSHHCAAVTKEGELYTWGSNTNGCLGHKIDELDVNYTYNPGHVGGFGALVNRIGRGFPRYVACGKEFTVVATLPYQGPDVTVATKLMEEAKIREQEELLKRRAAGIFD